MAIKFMNGIDLQNQKIVSLADPSAATDAVNKQYLDGVIRGLDWKQEVMAASTATVTLATPGTTLDGYTLVANDRVLLKDQTAPAENGIYVWTASGAALTRALDADSATELSGSTVTVQKGTVNADRVYRVTADDPITLGTTAITWAQVGAGGTTYLGGNGLVLTGTTFDVVPAASGGITVAADSISVDTSIVVRKYAIAIGNGALTSIPVVHNLGTRDVTVAIYNATTYEVIYADAVYTDTNTVTLAFAVAPTASQYRCVVHG